ncbi:GNAT family N-acetyltransferase [Gynurincola endophyticus]|uniref:GNAT family N-acetyltransferase n=1 Tax=Gynurincola endophyticus TaxID=2479004 RepID=UPI000F8ECD4B|nr:GNAT family N-acetyltransferase [Gynurincola endophyticus]
MEALRTDPGMFGSNYLQEEQYDQQHWISLLENKSRAIFGLYNEQQLIGLTGVVLNKENASNAIFIASFIRPAYRGKGLSRLFYQARIDWARQQKCQSITVSHREGNTVSRAANQYFGFKYSHAENIDWPDGVQAKSLIYTLQL